MAGGRAAAAGTAALLAGAALAAVPALPAPPAAAAQSPAACSASVALVNGGFEQPVVPSDNWQQRPEDQVPGWRTSATDRLIEIWRHPYQQIVPGSGSQYAELNATQASTLYQEVATVPGQTLRWQLQHRGRKGVDTMQVEIGAPGGPQVGQGELSDGNTAWGTHSGTYTVPAGQTTTRFGFKALRAAGKVVEGNFLDSISFGTGACVVTTATAAPAAGTPVDVGDVLTYTVTAANGGGNPAQGSVVTDELPAGTAFVPGSIRALNGTTATAVTDAAGDDAGGYDAATRTVALRVGDGAGASAGGAIPAGESRALSYQVRVERSAATTTLVDDAATTSTDPLSGTRSTSTSNTLTHPVAAAADLSAAARLVSGTPVAGLPVRFEATATASGPQTATAARLAVQVPAGLTGVAVTGPGGPCPVAAGTATCALGDLAPGAAGTATLTGDVPADAQPGTPLTVPVAASSALHDPTPTDATASATGSVTASADLAVALAHSPDPVAGADVTYTATVVNDGPSTARGVVLSDPLLTGSTHRSGGVTTTGGATGPCAPVATGTGAVECTVPDLAPGEVATATLVVGLSPGGGGAVDNAVSVTAATPDPDTADNHAAVASAGSTRADLGVELSLASATARPGQTVPFTLVVRNDGPSTATNVSFNTVVPAGVSVVRAPSPYCTPTACTLPALPAGAAVTLTGDAVVGPDAQAGRHRATTTVVSPTDDPDRSGNTDTVDFEFVLESDLALAQAVGAPGGGDLVAGEPVRTTLTATNAGPTRAEGLTLRQAVPAGQPVPAATAGAGSCTFAGTAAAGVTGAAGTLVCTLDALPAGATWDVVLDAVLPADHPEGAFTRTTELTSASPDPHPGDGTATTSTPVVRRADLSTTLTRTGGPVTAGGAVAYTATAANAGPSAAPAATLGVRLPAGLADVTAHVPGGTCTTAAGAVTCDLGTLAPGQQRTLALTGTVPADTAPGTRQSLTASLAAAAQDPDTAGNTASVSDAVTASADLAVALAHSPDPVAGGVVTYTATVTSAGPALARGVVLSVPLAHGSALVSADAPGGACAPTSPGAVECTLPDLAPGAGAVVDLRVRLDPAGDGAVDAAVSVSAATPDPDPAGNTATVSSGGSALADVSVDLRADRATAHPGDSVPFTLVVTNHGPSTATGVSFGTAVPPGVRVVRPASTLCTPTACTLPALAPHVPGTADDPLTLADGVVTITGTAEFGADVQAGRGRAGTTVVSPTPDPDRSDNTDAFDFDVLLSADLALTHAVTGPGGGDVVAGGALESRTSVTDRGPTRAEGLTLRLPVPAGQPVPAAGASLGSCAFHGDVTGEGLTAGGGTVDCTLEVLPAGRTWDVVLSTVLPATSTAASLTRTATVTAASPDPDPANDTATAAVPVRRVADLGLALGTTTPGVLRGGEVRLRAEVVNAGPSAAADAVVRLSTAGGTRLTAGTATAGSFDPATGEWRLPPLAPGDGAALDLVGTATGAGRATTTAAVTSTASTDPGAGDDSASVAVDVAEPPAAPRASLTLTTTALPAPAGPVAPPGASVRALSAAPVPPVALGAGGTVRYTYLVVNDGELAVTDVDVADDLVGAVTCPRTALDAGTSMTCTSLGAHLVTQADVDAGADVVNRARVRGRAPGAASALSFGPVSDPVPVVAAAPALAAEQSVAWDDADRDGAFDAGETLRWRVSVTNTGNVTLTDPAVTGLPAPVTCPRTALAPGASATCVSGTYVLTAEDAAAGARDDVASVVAAGPRGGAGGTATSSLTPGDPGTGGGGGGGGTGGPGTGGPGGTGTGGPGAGGTGTGGTGPGGTGSGGTGSTGGGSSGGTGTAGGTGTGGSTATGPRPTTGTPAAPSTPPARSTAGGTAGHRDTPRPGALARTGSETLAALGAGLLLVAAGLLALRAGRRRTR
ncbi:DUF7507 domain-containing protein [Kineococcus sp. SYSU DK005]|uniref:DUF7507 domain-containing protein n=1 Tax=Kineococcus sp. SYSU DK005 TaxID=3383126 RepID=UPI003D7D8AF5